MPNNTVPSLNWCPLTQYGLLAISSADNLKFLQGQLTCDVRDVSEGQWRYGALCTGKGRMIGNFLLMQALPGQHVLRLPLSTLDAVSATLKKFAPFYKGTLSPLTADYTGVGITGPAGDDFIQKVFAITPAEPNGVAVTDDAILIRLDTQRYECWIRSSVFAGYRALLAGATEQVADFWDLLNIRRGLGEVRGPTIEAWTPHMLNLQAVGAINFKKGCYTGQEIVARTEYRGQQKRAMYRLQGAGPLPEAGAPIRDGEQSAGEVVMASATDAGHWEALAVIGDSHLDKALHCQQERLQLLDLPYSPGKKVTG